jgi:hypothetical protein
MALDTETCTVYVRLLNEGTDVFRPVSAVRFESSLFKLLKPNDYDAEDEEWEFEPNSIVRCDEQSVSRQRILVAVESVDGTFETTL